MTVFLGPAKGNPFVWDFSVDLATEIPYHQAMARELNQAF